MSINSVKRTNNINWTITVFSKYLYIDSEYSIYAHLLHLSSLFWTHLRYLFVVLPVMYQHVSVLMGRERGGGMVRGGKGMGGESWHLSLIHI